MNPNTESIVRYIQQYRNLYTRQAIDQQLVTAGYSMSDIEAAWNAVEAPERQQIPQAPPAGVRTSRWGDDHVAEYEMPRRFVRSPLFWLTLVGFIVLSYGIPALFGFFGPENEAGVPSNNGAFIWGSFLLMQLAGIVAGLIFLGRNRPLAMGLLIGVLMALVGIPFILLCIGLGICVVMLGGFGGFGGF